MQCASCRAVYSNGLDICPRCKTAAPKSSAETDAGPAISPSDTVSAAASVTAPEEQQEIPSQANAPASSTLIEFPGVSRATRPQWRKDLSERVREIQERRARDSSQEAEEVRRMPVEQAVAGPATPQLGLVPQPDAPAVNPIVAAALKRLERARQPMPRGRASMGGAATAVARVAEDQYQPEANTATSQLSVPAPLPVDAPAQPSETGKVLEAKAAESVREHSLVVVPARKVTPESRPQQARAVPQTTGDDARALSNEELVKADSEAEIYDDRAPFMSRVAGSAVDLLVVAFASSPFAAIIELTNGNWADWRVGASMGGIVLVVLFLYLTASTALAGRTWGMSLLSLRAVDAETGLPPTTGQSVARALLYLLSLVTLGLGLLYALFDAEGRTAHDHLSGTIVVRD